MAKLTLTLLKKQFKEKTHEELIQELATLYKTFSQVKEYYQVQEQSSEELLKKYKHIIEKEFVDGVGRGSPKARFSVAKKAITDFKKVCSEIELIINLKLTFIENVSDFNRDFCPDVARFYDSPETMFHEVLVEIKTAQLLAKFKARIKRIAKEAPEGYDHQNMMAGYYEDFYGEII